LTPPPLPRPHRRGLIEATLPLHAHIYPFSPLPRAHRRGLIEAPAATTSARRLPSALPRPHRRGLIEALFRRPSPLTCSPLPRPHRRGLIEADDARSAQHGAQGLFRGLTAAASLKRRWRAARRSTSPWCSSAASPPRPH